MYRIKDIEEALTHLVGWEDHYNPSKSIDPELCESESGLYFQGANPMVTLDNIRAAMPDDWGVQYPAWDPSMNYPAGVVVRHSEDGAGTPLYWKSVSANAGEEPDAGSSVWRPYTIFSDFLRKLTRNGISKAVQTFIQVKQLDRETRSLMERKTFFDGAGRLCATLQNTRKVVGFEIVPVRSMGVTMKIERIGLQMTGGTGVVRMYLFHSSQTDTVKTFDLDFTVRNGGFQWFDLKDCYLPYISSSNNSGGSWFLCYNQDDLPAGMEAINVSKDWSREPCGTCNTGSIAVWREMSKYMQVTPFMYGAPEDFAAYPEMWDIAQTMYTNTQNYGLNCEITVGCDLTDFIISQRHLFSTVVQRQVAEIVLRTLALNPNVRVNRNQSNATRQDILYEVDGNTDSPRSGGLSYDLRKAYEALNIDTRGLDRICLGCGRPGVIYGSV